MTLTALTGLSLQQAVHLVINPQPNSGPHWTQTKLAGGDIKYEQHHREAVERLKEQRGSQETLRKISYKITQWLQ